jgi:hypothetical protein
MGGSPFQGRCPASDVNDRGCPGKADHLSVGGAAGNVSAQPLG